MSDHTTQSMAALAMLAALVALTPDVAAQGVPARNTSDVARAALGAARSGARETARLQAPRRGFDAHTRHQAALELQIGLALYQARDDYRAVGALRRWRILDSTPRSAYLSGLLVGHVYQRNGQHTESALSYEAAVLAAPDPHQRAWSYLLSTQQICVPMGIWGACAQRLAELGALESLAPAQRELILYQRTFAALMTDSEPPPLDPAALTDPELRAHATTLHGLHAHPDRRGIELRSPGLAAGLSAVLPGAGQAYNGRWSDAAIALVFNAAFAGATYYSFAELDSIPLGVVSAALFTGFYVGNIANAYVDAEAHNARAYDEFYSTLQREHWARVRFSVTDDAVTFGYSFGWPGELEPPPEPPPASPVQDEHF